MWVYEKAVLEAFLNALLHKYYFVKGISAGGRCPFLHCRKPIGIFLMVCGNT